MIGNRIKNFVSIALIQTILLMSVYTDASAKSQKSDISVSDTIKLLEANKAYLIDVRELDEILEDGMAKPAKWLSMEEIQVRGNQYENAIRTWPKATALIFYCVSGKRAGTAAEHFKSLGYKTSVMGGFKDWKAAGLPIRQKP